MSLEGFQVPGRVSLLGLEGSQVPGRVLILGLYGTQIPGRVLLLGSRGGQRYQEESRRVFVSAPQRTVRPWKAAARRVLLADALKGCSQSNTLCCALAALKGCAVKVGDPVVLSAIHSTPQKECLIHT